MMKTLGQHLARVHEDLSSVSASARLDAEILICHSFGLSREALTVAANRPAINSGVATLDELLGRRKLGEPIAYLTGRREFWSMDFKVDIFTLIPRPETEMLVEQALERIPNDKALRIADMGTGCGNIALAIARERPHCHITAVDRCAETLAVAKENAKRHRIENIDFVYSDWFENFSGERFDLIVSNPPYIAAGDPELERNVLEYEPRHALIAAEEGMADLHAVIQGAQQYLQPGGYLLLEHGHRQARKAIDLCRRYSYRDCTSVADYAGRDRIIVCRRP